jgi:hypothetical protein
MAGICSRHQGYDPNCKACKLTAADVLPNFKEKVAEAEAAGLVTCECGFNFYLTTLNCPKCGRKWKGKKIVTR